jgi:hypothetical protein
MTATADGDGLSHVWHSANDLELRLTMPEFKALLTLVANRVSFASVDDLRALGLRSERQRIAAGQALGKLLQASDLRGAALAELARPRKEVDS